MAMNPGKTSVLTNEINVTPMIDVLLVLLIIFMMVIPMSRKAIDLQLPRPVPTPDPTPPPVPGPAPAVPVLPVPSPLLVVSGAEVTGGAVVTGDSTTGFGSGGFTGGTARGAGFGIDVGSDLTRTNSTRSPREPGPLIPPPPPPAGPGPPPPTDGSWVKSDVPTIGARMRKRITACTRSDAVIPFHRSCFPGSGTPIGGR